MKRILLCFLGWTLLIGFAFGSVFVGTGEAKTCEPWVARVASVQGTVESLRVGETQWQPVVLNDTYCTGDGIRVMEKSRADLALVNEAVMRLNENSSITVEAMKDERTSVIDLLKGAAHFFSHRPNSLEVKTPYTIAGVRGTEFLIGVEDGRTSLSIFDGAVLARSDAGHLELVSGQSAVADAGKPPVLVTVVRPRDAVHWALYYPPVSYGPPERIQPGEPPRDPRIYARQASDLLAVGRVDEANVAIERALALDPNFSDAYAQQSIIAVVQNDKDRALTLAQRAVQTNPRSATAHIALSYAQQARFDLEGARKSLQEAVKVEPGNALAWARLAEAWSMSGDLGKSLKAAKKAVELDPGLSKTQTVLGFAYLTQVKTVKAKGAFEKAIELDQADPMPRLGLGLAKIREGHLHEGGKELVIAASLDPNNSLIRSYLGKVYYEEKKTRLDEREYNVAKELDPKDPTPWFYDAITKQTTNRPVEALHDLQKAMELNDNRAVYRSKLLLDSDEAARGTSLAYIYNDLGFQERALAEGWRSVDLDPTNYSAHRFLADSYSILPRHEIARVSELLQAQLLQPLNITPIQPALAESNLFLLSSLGPSNLSYNEFNPIMFSRNRATMTVSGIAGENNMYAGEGIFSAIYNKFSVSGGFTHFQTDGWRENADQKDNIGNLFAQYQVTHNTNIQAEYRHRDLDRGDILLRFFKDDFSKNRRQEDETQTFRVGFRHDFSPASILMGNFSYNKADRDFSDLLFLDFGLPTLTSAAVGLGAEEDGYSSEIQHLYRSKYVNLVSGFGYFDIDRKDISSTQINAFDIFSSEKTKTNTAHLNFYLYSYLHLPKDLTITIGGSADSFDLDVKENDNDDINKDQFNPKFGITWQPFPGTTVRGAVFRTLKRTLITDQTLEPTQVAGFNQFFDDANASRIWRYGVGIDQKFTNCVYGGVEVSKRDLEVPFSLVNPQTLQPSTATADWEEYMARVYLYWTPHRWLALSAGYQYEKLDRTVEFNFGLKKLETHSVPLGINFFHPCGLMAGLKATYINQRGDFETLAAEIGELRKGRSDFWVVDAALSYRLPKRYGFVTIGVRNLFDESFRFAETDFENARIQPDRAVFGKVTIQF